jgi:dipeptidyl aminopeptidase/acylaminoacyl peptidase
MDPAATEDTWKARFRAPRIELPEWARDAPHRSFYTSNVSGTREIYTWDRETDTHTKVTERPNGTTDATISPDGAEVWWFDDTDGDEFGVWRRQPFGSPPGSEQEALAGVPAAYSAGLEIGRHVAVVGGATDAGSEVWAVVLGGTPQLLYAHAEDASVDALSADETLVAIGHSEHGDSMHPDLRVLRVDDGGKSGELSDGPGRGLHAVGFSPVSGDQRILVVHERRGRSELLLWDPTTGVEVELDLDVAGDLDGRWFPDGTALLVIAERHGRVTLHRYHLATSELSSVDTPAGVIDTAAVRPDGSVEFAWSAAATPTELRVTGRAQPLLAPGGPSAPRSESLREAWVAGEGGPIHVLWALPTGDRPAPLATIFSIHGGPHWLDSDSFSPARAAWLDAGYAVVHVNYRGSTGYGSAWRDAINGRPGLTELADIAAAHGWAVESGIADAERCVLAGRSWGGYLTLLGLGTQPELWAAGVAGVPVADYPAAYADEMEQLKAMDRVLFGGSPSEVPDAYAVASPLTYADRVRVPVLITAGRNDPRCPIRQIENYLARMAQLGKVCEEYRYDAGHGSVVVEESIREMAAELDFVHRHVPATTPTT